MTDFGRRHLRPYNFLSNLVFADMYKSIIAGTFQHINDFSAGYAFYFHNYTHDLNDEIDYYIFAKAGTRTLQILVKTSTASPIVSIYLDDVLQGTVDLYDASPARNQLMTLSLTVIGTKRHTLRLKVTGKHDSSNNHYIYMTWLRII